MPAVRIDTKSRKSGLTKCTAASHKKRQVLALLSCSSSALLPSPSSFPETLAHCLPISLVLSLVIVLFFVSSGVFFVNLFVMKFSRVTFAVLALLVLASANFLEDEVRYMSRTPPSLSQYAL